MIIAYAVKQISLSEFITLIRASLVEFDSIKVKNINSIPSIDCLEDHVQQMPLFPDINSFPEIPEFLQVDEYFDIKRGITGSEEDIPYERNAFTKLPMECNYEHKKF